MQRRQRTHPRVLPLFALLLALLLPAAGLRRRRLTSRAQRPPRRPEGPPREIKPMADATAVVEKQLVKPLAEKEARRSRFSRAYIPPQARRVRVVDHERSTDGRGAEFLPFAVDERPGRSPPGPPTTPAAGARMPSSAACIRRATRSSSSAVTGSSGRACSSARRPPPTTRSVVRHRRGSPQARRPSRVRRRSRLAASLCRLAPQPPGASPRSPLASPPRQGATG